MSSLKIHNQITEADLEISFKVCSLADVWSHLYILEDICRDMWTARRELEYMFIPVSLTACPLSINFRNTFFANSLEYFQMHQICSNQKAKVFCQHLTTSKERTLDLNRKE